MVRTMQNATGHGVTVNTIPQKYTLDYNIGVGPIVIAVNGLTTALSDDDFGRWFARVTYPNMFATPAGAEWYAKNNPAKPIPIPFLNAKLREYQHLSLFRLLLSNCGLFLDMGLGKTLIALAYCLYMHQTKGHRTFMVLCPPSCFVTWMDEIEKFVLKDHEIHIAHGPRRKKVLKSARFSNRDKLCFIVTSYETLPSLLNDLESIEIQAIFADEAQKIKNLSTARTRAAYTLRKQHPQAARYALSGTPSTKDPIGFFSILEWLHHGYSGAPNLTIFEQTYLQTKLFAKALTPSGQEVHVLAEPHEQKQRWLGRNRPGITEGPTYAQLGFSFGTHPGPKTIRILHHYKRPLGNKNLDQLHRLLQRRIYAVRKDEVLHDLPPKSFTRRHVTLPSKTMRVYKDVLLKHQSELNGKTIKFNEKNSPFAKLHQIANGFLNLENEKEPLIFDKDPKLTVLDEILEERGEQKVIIWSPYPFQIGRISTHLKKKKIKHVTLHGGVPVAARRDHIHQFQNDSETGVIAANPEVGGVGLNLQCSNIQVFMANWWKPDTRIQAIDRSHRSGQKHAVTIIDICAENTIEAQILKTLQKRIDTEKHVMSFSELKGA